MPDWFRLRCEEGTGSAASNHPITFPTGIKVLHEPPNPNVDIVFVHGLTGDREKTWAARNQSPWPQTELPKRIPQARVITFGYDAYISNWRHVVSENRLGDHAKDLLNEIAACRIGAERRPIIFVAHSLGGLVVKDALLAAWRDGRKHIEQILESTRAIAFLGTPHGGSGLAAWAERSVRFLGIFKQANADILALLRPNSEVLSRVHDDFLRMIRPRTDGIKQHMIMVTCFYEALPMPCIGFVVRMGSAVIAGYDRISIQANHRDMARFHSGGDPGFKSLVAELDKWVRLTSSTIGSASMFYENTTLEASKMAQDNLEIACLHSTAFVEMENRRMAIEEPAAETCNWIFDHAIYREWCGRENIEASQGLLWIKGKPGSGKSTIMKQIHKRTSTEEGNSITCLAFFFSARGAEIERSPYGLYRALVHQLVWQKRSFLQDLSVLYDEKVKKVGANNFEWHLKELQKFFHDAITQPGQGTVKVFVDALDECIEEDVRKVVRAFEESAGVAMANDAELNICWSSRHYPHIKVCKSHEVLMEHQNASDIALYVHNMLSKESTTSHSNIEEKIVRKANGVFIWVVLVVNRLFGAAEYEQSRSEKMRILDQIPSELNGLFGVILGTVKELHRPETLLFFQWVLLATRPLTLDEFRYAIAFSAEPPPTSIKAWKLGDRYLESETALTSLIRDRSGGLLEVVEAEGSRVIQFIHESVRDFLLSDASLAILGIDENNNFAHSGHERLKQSCIAYLKIDELRKIPSLRLMKPRPFIGHVDLLHPSGRQHVIAMYPHNRGRSALKKSESILSHPFTRYATYSWISHAKAAEAAGRSQKELYHWAKHPSFERWLSLAASGNFPSWVRTSPGSSPQEVLFYITCENGLCTCVAPYVASDADPLQILQAQKRTLLLAASRGDDSLVRELLDNGAPVDTAWGRELLDRAPVVTAWRLRRSNKNSLHEAVERGHLDVVRTLLERGINVEAQTETGKTALYIAIEDHNEAIVEALIEGGAYIESTASDGYTALQLAAVEGDPGLVQILVDAGANVNAKGADHMTAIQLACSVDPTVSIHGNWNEVISILIEAGADLGGQSVESLLSRHTSDKTGHLLEV